MAIAKKPKSNTNAITPVDDIKADAFIAGADKTALLTVPPPAPESSRTPVMIRFDTTLLRQIDAAAKKLHLSRSAWIQSTLSRVLESGEG